MNNEINIKRMKEWKNKLNDLTFFVREKQKINCIFLWKKYDVTFFGLKKMDFIARFIYKDMENVKVVLPLLFFLQKKYSFIYMDQIYSKQHKI